MLHSTILSGKFGFTGPESYHFHALLYLAATIQALDHQAQIYVVAENAGSILQTPAFRRLGVVHKKALKGARHGPPVLHAAPTTAFRTVVLPAPSGRVPSSVPLP